MLIFLQFLFTSDQPNVDPFSNIFRGFAKDGIIHQMEEISLEISLGGSSQRNVYFNIWFQQI